MYSRPSEELSLARKHGTVPVLPVFMLIPLYFVNPKTGQYETPISNMETFFFEEMTFEIEMVETPKKHGVSPAKLNKDKRWYETAKL